MAKKSIKIIALILMAILVVASLSQVVFAAAETVTAADYLNPNSFADASDSTGAAASISRIVGSALTIVQVVGTGVAVIMLVVLAIKYISAAPGDKADIKKHAVVYIVGAIVLFAATGILGIIKNFSSNISAS